MDIQSLLPYIGGAIVIILLLLIVTIGYVKAPPDTAYIISGLRKKIIVGKASIKIPFLERLDKLSLKLIPIDVKTSSMVPTADYINIQVDAAVNVKVGSDSNKLELAAQNFLNQNSDYMARVAREVLEGNMREIVGRMRLEEMVSDRQKFAELVKENAMPDLAAMGLNIVSFNVQNFTDANGVIDDLGIDNISQIKKKAAIAKAEADRQANDARVAAEREIAIKNNDLSIQKAELKKVADVKQATADAAYEIEKENQMQSCIRVRRKQKQRSSKFSRKRKHSAQKRMRTDTAESGKHRVFSWLVKRRRKQFVQRVLPRQRLWIKKQRHTRNIPELPWRKC